MVGVVLTAGILVLTAGHATAGKKKDAKVHFDNGVALYNKGDFTGALAEFLKAHEKSPHYAPLYNIAKCQMELEDYLDAMKTFEQYLDEGRTEIPKPRTDEVEELLVELRELLCQLSLDVDVDGASILIDGKLVTTTPAEEIIFVDAGEHVLRVEKDGYDPYQKELVLSRGEKASHVIQLEKTEVAPPSGPLPPPPAPVEPQEPARARLRPPPFIAVISVSGGLLIASAVLGGLVVSRSKEYDSMGADDDWQSYRKTTTNMARATDALWIVGGAGLVTAILLAVFTDFGGREEPRAALGIDAGPGSFRLEMRMRF
jgi:hypothetical protein